MNVSEDHIKRLENLNVDFYTLAKLGFMKVLDDDNDLSFIRINKGNGSMCIIKRHGRVFKKWIICYSQSVFKTESSIVFKGRFKSKNHFMKEINKVPLT